MSIHIRIKKGGIPGLRIGEDAVVDGAYAKALQKGGMAWVTGGDADDFVQYELEPDTDVGPPTPYATPDTVVAVTPSKEA